MLTCAIALPHPPIILPEIGKGEEKKIQSTIDAYRESVRFLAGYKPGTVIVISPHATSYADYFHISPGKGAKGDFSRYGAGSVVVQAAYDEELVQAIAGEARRMDIPAGTQGELDRALDHGTMIPLRFLQEVYSSFRVVRIGLSGLGRDMHYRLGMCIAAAAEKKKRRISIIASGDLSHRLKDDGPYGYRPEGPQLDAEITGALKDGDFLRLLSIDPALAERGAECGLNSFIIMAGAFDGCEVNARLLSYADAFGVGYAVATFAPGAPDAKRHPLDTYKRQASEETDAARTKEDAYVRLARGAIESYVRTGKRLRVPEDLPDGMLHRRAGTFVSIHEYGRLRGCIGTTAPTTGSIAEEIIDNAINAAASDPRFDAVREEELAYLQIKVDVLMPPENIPSAAALDVKRYGVIVSSGARRGLLLPDLEGVDTVEEQVNIAKQKAGIRPHESVRLQRFEVERHQ